MNYITRFPAWHWIFCCSLQSYSLSCLIGVKMSDHTITRSCTVINSHSWINVQQTEAWYHSIHNILSSSLLTKNTKIKIHKTIILRDVLYGQEIWSHWGRNIGWGCSRIGCWGGYLGLKPGLDGAWLVQWRDVTCSANRSEQKRQSGYTTRRSSANGGPAALLR
jgi:hypothetical protein